MKNRGMVLFSGGVVLLLAASSFYVGAQLPADAQVPIHWNAAGQIDGYAGKWTGLLIGPVMALVASLIFLLVAVAEPHQDNLAKSRALMLIGWFGMLGAAAVVEFSQVATLLGWSVRVPVLIVGGMGLFFVILGNQLSKSRQMYMVGIPTPWTLADPDIWIATHRLGGKLMMLAGLVWVIAAACGWVGALAAPILVAVMLVSALVPVVYSFVLWRRRGKRA
jgi:uncharacterized membrane protein